MKDVFLPQVPLLIKNNIINQEYDTEHAGAVSNICFNEQILIQWKSQKIEENSLYLHRQPEFQLVNFIKVHKCNKKVK